MSIFGERPKKPERPRRYEYKIYRWHIRKAGSALDNEIQTLLNLWGDQGWRLMHQASDFEHVLFFLEREKE